MEQKKWKMLKAQDSRGNEKGSRPPNKTNVRELSEDGGENVQTLNVGHETAGDAFICLMDVVLTKMFWT